MHAIKPGRLSLLVPVVFLALGCTLQNKAVAPKHSVSSGDLRASFYPATHQTKNPRPVVVLTDPVLIDKSLLEKSDGLIHQLNYHGYAVWLITWTKGNRPLAAGREAFNQNGVALTRRIHLMMGKQPLVIGGLSLGGGVLWHGYLQKAAAAQVGIQSVFTMGTAVDYNYPGSFVEVMNTKFQPGPLAPQAETICRTDRKFCSRFTILNEKYRKYLGSWPAAIAVPDKKSLNALPWPALFINGKKDNVAPSEAMYFALYLPYATKHPERLVDSTSPRLMLLAGHANHFSINFDHLDLFWHPVAPGTVYEYLHRWMEGR